MFDYLACPYPEGYISSEFSHVFNHEDIQTVVFTGNEDEEEDQFQTVLVAKSLNPKKAGWR